LLLGSGKQDQGKQQAHLVVGGYSKPSEIEVRKEKVRYGNDVWTESRYAHRSLPAASINQ